jgi:hypothetical protein
MGPLRILFKSYKGPLLVMVGNHGPSPHCCPIKDIVVLVMMVGSPKPPLYLTLLSYIGHRGPSSDARETWALSASHVFVR